MCSQVKLKSVNFPFSPVEILIVLIALSPSLRSSAGAIENGNSSQNQSTNALNKTNVFVRSSPPTKSLFSNQLFQPDSGLMKTLTPYPLRESYIAYEQAHPSDTYSGGQDNFEQYFKPNKFPPPGPGYDTSDYYTTRLENTYPPLSSQYPPPSSQYPPPSTQYQPPSSQYHPQLQPQSPVYLPLAPPPPPPPFLRLVKIPGELKLSVSTIGGRNTLEIFCEFPGYLLIVQQIYWHVIPPPTSLLLPYGTFYDSRNGFAPRVTVTRISKWKSILRVRDYTSDDFGTYRCVSTAILPDDPEPSYPYPYAQPRPTAPQLPPTSYLLHFPHDTFNELRSSASTIASSHRESEGVEKGEEKASSRQERRIKFRRSKREVFGVYAPFFKPHYGIYRVFKEVRFFGDAFGSGSEIVENTISGPEEAGGGSGGSSGTGKIHQNASIEDNKRTRSGRRKFDFVFNRKSKVLF